MTTDSGRDYLLRMRADGRTYDEIRDAFRTSGWAETDIDALFASLAATTVAPALSPDDLDASTSGTGAPAPAWVLEMGWSWGAFGLSWIWGIVNGVWIALLALLGLIPYLSLFVLGFRIWLGIKGHSLAWQHRRFGSVAHFRRAMRSWDIVGLIVFIVAAAGVVALAAFVIFNVYSGRSDKTQETSCRRNEKQIALGVLGFAADHNWTLPSSSALRHDVQPYIKNSAVWQCPSRDGNTYALAPTLSGAHLTSVGDPAHTVLLYEANSAGQPILPHRGGADFAFVDGHARWLVGPSAKAALTQMGLTPPATAPKTSAGSTRTQKGLRRVL